MREIQTPVAELPWLAEFGNSLRCPLSLTRSRFQSPCWFLDLTFERSTAAREPAPG